MKRLFLILFFAFPLYSADIKLAWDADATWPADTVIRIYEHNGSNYTLAGTSVTGATEVTLPDVQQGRHLYVARAYSASLAIESGDSNEVEVKFINPPGHVRFMVVVGN